MIRSLAKQSVGLVCGVAVTLAVVLAVPATARWLETPVASPAAEEVTVAPVAPVLHYQGRLLDPTTGQAKPDGAYSMAFRLYDTGSGGSALWTESKSVTVSRGLFSTLLGDTTALDLAHFDGRELYLGVTVGSDPEAQPRQRIAFVAYSLYAANADKLDGQDATAFAPVSHIHTGSDIQDGTISTAKLADGAVTRAKLAPGVAPKFFSLDPYAAYLEGQASFDAGFGAFGGIVFPEAAGTSSLALGFTIPPDYTPGTPLVIRLLWHTSGANCAISFRPNFISVSRVGRTHLVGAGASTGLTVVGGQVLSAGASANITQQVLVTVTSPVSGIDLAPGDGILFGLFRAASDANDTCTSDMVIQSISVSYE